MAEHERRSPELLDNENLIIISNTQNNTSEVNEHIMASSPPNVLQVVNTEEVDANPVNDAEPNRNEEQEEERTMHNEILIVAENTLSSGSPATKKQKLNHDEEDANPIFSLDDSRSDAQTCSICLDIWSNYGEHRLCSLKCGHLFGLSCIKKWLEPLRTVDRKCPECNTKANKRDIRILYAKKLLATDTSELEKVKEDLKICEKKCVEHERTIDTLKSKHQAYETQISLLQGQIMHLEKQILNDNAASSFLTHLHDFDLCSKGGCRVMAYNPWHRTLIATTASPYETTRMHAEDHGFRKIMLETMSLSMFTQTHSKSIRDVTFSNSDPNTCLSVGFDEHIALFDIRTCALMHKYRVPNTMFWSCCWSRTNENNFHVGTQYGHILTYDLRHLRGAVTTLENQNDRSPIVSLASVSSFPSYQYSINGFLACHLNNCYANMYRGRIQMQQRLDIKGPFMSVRYDDDSKHVLLSCRANALNQSVRHHVCLLSKESVMPEQPNLRCEVIYTFNGGMTQQRLTRPCYMYLKNDTLVAASNESNCIQFWSMTTGKEVHTLPFSASVVDTCSFRVDDTYLALLTPQKVHLYKTSE